MSDINFKIIKMKDFNHPSNWKYDLSLPLGDIHQIHGEAPYKREVFMTVAQQDEGLICGITIGDEGKWTSWPPHQHTNDLEEIYCFFNIPQPKTAF
jgi:5-deoxy-glucuronate isomerase